MINLEFLLPDGGRVMVYDVHPQSQETPIGIPDGAVSVRVWLGTVAGQQFAAELNEAADG